MSLVIKLSGGVQLELRITDKVPLSTNSMSVTSVSFDDDLREGIQLALKKFVSGTLRWIAWKIHEGRQVDADGPSLILILYAEAEEVHLQLEKFCQSGEGQKRLQGMFRAFGYNTDFKISVRRQDKICATNIEYSILPAPLHSVGKNGDTFKSEFTDKADKVTASAMARPGVPSLQDNLKRYELEKVNIPSGEYEWAKQMMTKYIMDGIVNYIRENSSYVVQVHFTGSSYEGLKTQHADEFDLMVQVKHKDVNYERVDGVPGYAVMVPKNGAEDPFYHKLLDDGKISPIKFRTQEFFSLVQRGVNHLENLEGNKSKFKPSSHGPAVQVDITPGPDEKFKLKISVDLVLCYMFDDGNHFVAKPFKEYADGDVKSSLPCKAELLWRQSFSSKEKDMLQKMDKGDQGCRHRCVRIIKTIFCNDTTLKKLTSYHIKTTFLHYNKEANLAWKDSDLGDRFLGILARMIHYIKERQMPHNYVHDLNLLDGFKDITLNNIQGRLERLLKRLNDPEQQAKEFSKFLEK